MRARRSRFFPAAKTKIVQHEVSQPLEAFLMIQLIDRHLILRLAKISPRKLRQMAHTCLENCPARICG